MNTTFSLTNVQDTRKTQPLSEHPCRHEAATFHSLKGKTLVVKLGGSTLAYQRMVLRDLICLQVLGVHPVLVHGGGPSINSMLQALHIPTRFERGMRVTDAQTLGIACMVLRGHINEHLVLFAEELGGKAVGLSGTDGNMIQAHIADSRLGFVGEIDTVDPTLVLNLLSQGYLPIIAPLGRGVDGGCLNINADLVAASLAQALPAERLVFLSDVPGICGADGALLSEVSETEVDQLIEEGIIHGGMIPKVTACLKAVTTVPCVHIVDGTEPHVLLHEVDNKQQRGTMVVRSHFSPLNH